MATISLNYGVLRKPGFVQGLTKIAGYTGYAGNDAINVAKIYRNLLSESKNMEEAFKALAKTYAIESGDGTKIDPSRKEEWERSLSVFDQTPIHIEGDLIPFSSLQGAKLSPIEIEALDQFITFAS